ncbi:cytochrome P450 [Pilatotrama ljubarskyi]|nr:cytochrome P450 [Pilatotrama ljubarskyi]
MASLMLFCSVAAAILALVWPQIRRRVKQFQLLRKVPGPTSLSIWTGVSKQLHSPYAIPYREEILTSYGRVIRLPDRLGEVHLAVADPLALATMFGKYRDAFDLSESRLETGNTVFGPGLTAVKGREHLEQRKHLSPVFSTRYIRDMIPTFDAVAQELVQVMRSQIAGASTEVEIAEYMSRFSLECVGRAVLAYSFGPMEKHGTGYSRALKEFGPTIVQLNAWRPLLPWLKRVFPRSWLRYSAEVIPYAPLQRRRSISDSVNATARQILQQKKETLRDGDKIVKQEFGEGKDLISMLGTLQLPLVVGCVAKAVQRNTMPSPLGTSRHSPRTISSDRCRAYPDSSKVSLRSSFGAYSMLLLQATDSTSSTLVRILQQLSHYPEVQERVRQELLEATSGTGRTVQDMNFESYAQLPYMDAVIREAIRMYPGFYMTSRVYVALRALGCLNGFPSDHHAPSSIHSSDQDTVLPLSAPIQGVDGQPIEELAIPAGTTVWLNIFGVNRDPTTWGPDAAEWKPERWLSPLPQSLTDAHIPSVFANTMTFVAGPRSCIGYNFALAEIRVVLAHLLLAFHGIASPSVKGSKTAKPELPLVLTSL